MKLSEKRQIAREIAMRFLGLPYIWGGDDPVKGFDCSGFVIEILQSVGIMARGADATADGLMARFDNRVTTTPSLGCLVFYGVQRHASHVEFCLSDELSIGASGGGAANVTVDDAIRRNSYIKIRPLRREGLLCFVDPF